MNQKNLTDVCVISEDPFFIGRIKIFSQKSKLTFEYINSPDCKSTATLFLIDIDKLDTFLNEKLYSDTFKYIVHGEQKDLALSFNAGCTDFLKEPWKSDELEARISKIQSSTKVIIQWEKLILSRKTLSTGNYSTDICIEEYIILEKLLVNRGEPVPREALIFSLLGRYKKNSRVVDMHISNLRKKIKTLQQYDDSCCGSIKTVRSYGYLVI